VGSIEPEFRRISAWLDLVEALRIRDDEIFGTSGDTDLLCRLAGRRSQRSLPDHPFRHGP
jgi:hypothetical protein